MVTAGPLRGRARRALLATCCLAGMLVPCVAVAQSEKPSEQAPPPNPAASSKPGPSQPAPTAVSEAERKARKAWQAAIGAKAPPKKGCFTATFPDTEWKEVPCTKPPQIPYPPRRGSHPNAIGGGSNNDASAQVASQIVSATGSFDSVTGVTSEYGFAVVWIKR